MPKQRKNEITKIVPVTIYYKVNVSGGTFKDRQWKAKELTKEIKKELFQSTGGGATAPSGQTVGFSAYRIRTNKS